MKETYYEINEKIDAIQWTGDNDIEVSNHLILKGFQVWRVVGKANGDRLMITKGVSVPAVHMVCGLDTWIGINNAGILFQLDPSKYLSQAQVDQLS